MNDVIENLKYLISDECTDTQSDYRDDIEKAINFIEKCCELKEELTDMYKRADDIVSSFVIGRLHTNREVETYACFEAEKYVVDSMQDISCIIDILEGIE